MLHNTYENASRRVKTFWVEKPPEYVLIRFLQNAYIRIGTRFIESLPDQRPFRVLP